MDVSLSERELRCYLIEHLDKIAPPGIKLAPGQSLENSGDFLARVYRGERQIGWCVVVPKARSLNDADVGHVIRQAGLHVLAAYGSVVLGRLPRMILVGSSCPLAIVAGCVGAGVAVWTYKLGLDGIEFERLTDEAHLRQLLATLG